MASLCCNDSNFQAGTLHAYDSDGYATAKRLVWMNGLVAKATRLMDRSLCENNVLCFVQVWNTGLPIQMPNVGG